HAGNGRADRDERAAYVVQRHWFVPERPGRGGPQFLVDSGRHEVAVTGPFVAPRPRIGARLQHLGGEGETGVPLVHAHAERGREGRAGVGADLVAGSALHAHHEGGAGGPGFLRDAGERVVVHGPQRVRRFLEPAHEVRHPRAAARRAVLAAGVRGVVLAARGGRFPRPVAVRAEPRLTRGDDRLERP